MTRNLTALFLLIVISLTGYSQKITIKNKSTQQPINHVFIYNKTQNNSTLTNEKGEAKLEKGLPNDIILVQHPSYKNQYLSYDSLKSLNFSLEMEEALINLNEIVVSANKWEQNLGEVPNKIATIKPKDITFENPQTAADALANTHQVFIQKSQLGGGSPMIRGFAANSVLIVVDGVRMNNAIYRSGNLQNVISLDPNSMEGMEVIFGPGSVIYGSDALGGVMDFHTKKAIPSYNNEIYAKGDAFVRFSSANNETTSHLDFNFGYKRLASLTSITYSKFDDLRAGGYRPTYKDFGLRPEYARTINGKDTIVENSDENIQKESGYQQFNLLQKFRWVVSENIDLTYSFHYSNTSDIPRYDRLIQYKSDDTLKYAKWYYGPQTWMMHNLQVSLNEKTAIYDNMRLVAAYQDYTESRNDRRLFSTTLRKRTEHVSLGSINIDFDKEFSKKFTSYYGVEAIMNIIDSEGEKTNINTNETKKCAPRYPDNGANYNVFAAYISHKYKLGKKINLTSGLRYSHVLSESKFSKEFYDFPFEKINLDFGSLNGSVGAVYNPTNNLRFNLVASSGFRAPNIDDIAKVFDSEPGTVVVPNENLKPEFAYNLDFGVLTKINDKVKIDITAYGTLIEDVIVRRDFTFNGKDSIMYDGEMSKVQAQVNANEGYIWGINGAIFFSLNKNFEFYSALNYSEGMDKTNDVPLRHVPPTFGSSGITYKNEKARIKFYSNYNGKIDFEDLAPSEQSKSHLYTEDGAPAWYTLNLKASYNIYKKIYVVAGVENIMDLHYRPYSSGISAPGRNIIISFKTSI